MMNLHKIEKQLILYTKGHFKRIKYEQDLKYFAAELYALSPEQVEWYSISHMVTDVYQKLVDHGLISFNLKNFL
jgi:predicted aldo/keto reductase-like oxidoreductase